MAMTDLDTIEAQIQLTEAKLQRLYNERAQHTTKIVHEYLHSNNDEYRAWEVDMLGKPKYAPEVHQKLGNMLYEVEFVIEVDVSTGDYKILQVIDGDQRLYPRD